MVELETDDIDRFVGRYSLGRDSNPLNTTDSLHFLRFKVPGGFLNSNQMRGVAELTQTYSRGQAEITNRQDIQLHWIEGQDALEIFAAMEELGFTTDMCGQGFSGARYGDARNIVCCPVSGIVREELVNGAPLLNKLSDFFIGNADFQDMPRKFKFSISGCGHDCTRAVTNDLAIVGVERGAELGFTMLIGGSMGASQPGPRLTESTGVFFEPEKAFDVAVATIEIHRDYGSRESKATARFKWLLHQWGVEKFLEKLQDKLGSPLKTYECPIFRYDGGHEGVQPQRQLGFHFVNIPLLGGILTSDQMFSIANLAEEYGNGDLRLTLAQNLI
ncbi:MAG: nitrite/sulfite reductase, partial [Candidatus Bathyarchaeota archaeon]